MTGQPSFPDDYLGAVTEARFEATFGTSAIISKGAAADLIGIDEKTLDALTEDGIIRSVPRGAKRRGYTERDLRAYLIESTAACRSTSQRRVGSSPTTSGFKVVDIMAVRARRPDAQRKPTRSGNGRPRPKAS